MEGKEWKRKWGETERKKEEQEAELEKYTEESGNLRLWLGLAPCPAGSLSAVSDLAFMPETAGGVNSQPSPEAKAGPMFAHTNRPPVTIQTTPIRHNGSSTFLKLLRNLFMSQQP